MIFSIINDFCVLGNQEQIASEYVGLTLNFIAQEKYQDLIGKMCSFYLYISDNYLK